MGNVSGRGDGEGTASNSRDELVEIELKDEEKFQPPAMLGFSSFNPLAYHLPSTSSQVPTTFWQGAGHPKVSSQRKKAGLIIWSHGGREVALTGSWDNYETLEPLNLLGKDFIIMKMLPPDVYQYRFIVDNQLRYAPNFPWGYDGSGSAYNILDLRDLIPGASGSHFEFAPSLFPPQSSSLDSYSEPQPPPLNIIPVARANLSEFESPPSPLSSYGNEALSGEDFSKLPPELPPQLHMTPMPDQSTAGGTEQPIPIPHHSCLNHLSIRNTGTDAQFVALSSTFRFHQKYVTLLLYKAPKR